MRTAQSGFSEPSQSREIKRARELAELALRRATERPKPKPTGGGIIVATEAVGINSPTPGFMTFTGWTFNTDPYGAGTPGPSLSPASDPAHFTIGEPGWYWFRWRQSLIFPDTPGAPTSAQCAIDNSRLSGIPDLVWTAPIVPNHYGVTGYVASAVDQSGGPIYCAAGDTIRPYVGWKGVGTPLASYGLHLFVARFA